jgi:hypothetical protein
MASYWSHSCWLERDDKKFERVKTCQNTISTFKSFKTQVDCISLSHILATMTLWLHFESLWVRIKPLGRLIMVDPRMHVPESNAIDKYSTVQVKSKLWAWTRSPMLCFWSQILRSCSVQVHRAPHDTRDARMLCSSSSDPLSASSAPEASADFPDNISVIYKYNIYIYIYLFIYLFVYLFIYLFVLYIYICVLYIYIHTDTLFTSFILIICSIYAVRRSI